MAQVKDNLFFSLFDQVKEKKKSLVQMAIEAGICPETANKDERQRASDLMNKLNVRLEKTMAAMENTGSVRIPLIDYVLRETIFAGEPIAQAMSHLKTAGLNDTELATIEQMVNSLLGKFPAHSRRADPQLGTGKIYEPHSKVNEDAPPYGRLTPISARQTPISRRDELPVYPVFDEKKPKAVPIPRWDSFGGGIAAGFGDELERSPELTYVRELPDWTNVHSIIVRGTSMSNTLLPGDLILAKKIGGDDGIKLASLEKGESKNSRKILQREIPDDELYILTINGEHTVKRVQYAGTDADWHLLIVPDNRIEYKIQVIGRSDKITFHARVLGIGDKQYVKRK